jgi:predicted kinase
MAMGLQVIMLIGIPGSGKSTRVLSLRPEIPGPVRTISSDDIRAEVFGDIADMSRNSEVFMLMKKFMAQALAKSESVILDATFVLRSERAPYIQLAREHGAMVTAFYVKTSLTDALARNEARVRQVPSEAIRLRYLELEEPSEDEGFDRIIVAGGQ